MNQWLAYWVALITAPAAIGTAMAAGEPCRLPFREQFLTATLDRDWTIHVSEGNKITVDKGRLRIDARQNTYAHIGRPLGTDRVRAWAVLTPEDAVSWITSLFLYWEERNWCQVSVLRDGMFYTVELVDGVPHETRVRPCEPKDRQGVAIELAEDCVRYQHSADGQNWTTMRVTRRKGSWRGRPPQKLFVGKGYSAQADGARQYPAADLRNDYPDPGPPIQAFIHEVGVERLAPERARMTDADLALLITADRDILGEKELAGDRDPSFDTVSRYFPPMRFPREVVGSQEGPDEMGVLPDGTLEFDTLRARFEMGRPGVALGSAGCRKRLLNGYLPVVIAASRNDGLDVEQTVFGWPPKVDDRGTFDAYLRLNVSNPEERQRGVPVRFRVFDDQGHETEAVDGGELRLVGKQSASLNIWLSGPKLRPALVEGEEFSQRLAATVNHWETLLGQGTRIETPEPRVNEAFRAWLAYSFLNVDLRHGRYESHDGSGFYEAVFGYSAALYCHALDLVGYHAESARYLESLAQFVTPEGRFEVNFGLPDGGALLYAIGEHHRLTGDADWVRRIAPTLVKMGDWIIARRQEERARQPADSPLHGLLKGKPYCDEGPPAYSYFTDVYFVVGLESAAQALAAAGMNAEAETLAREAAAYRADIVQSMQRAVVQRDGLSMLPLFPETHALLRRADYTARDYYSLIAGCVLETGFLRPEDPPAGWIRQLLEQRSGLLLGLAAFGDGVDHAYTYGYWMDCLARDEVKRVLLGFYGSLAYGMSRETYSSVEVTHLRDGRNELTLPHQYSHTQQIRLLRNMLVREVGNELWLGQAIPRPWLADGRQVRVVRAPTAFGEVSYTLQSHDAGQTIAATVSPPTRHPPAALRLRTRQAERRAIASVRVNGQPSSEFTPDTVVLKPTGQTIAVEIRYGDAEVPASK